MSVTEFVFCAAMPYTNAEPPKANWRHSEHENNRTDKFTHKDVIQDSWILHRVRKGLDRTCARDVLTKRRDSVLW